MRALDREDRNDDMVEADDDDTPTPPSAKVEQLKKRKELYEGYLDELSKSGDTQKLTTDPEAPMMHSHKDGFHCCYNVQTAGGLHPEWNGSLCRF